MLTDFCVLRQQITPLYIPPVLLSLLFLTPVNETFSSLGCELARPFVCESTEAN